MAVWLRVLANPKVLKRFLQTKAGRKAALKYGTMLLNSKMVQDSVNKFMNKNDRALSDDKAYAAQTKQYAALQKQIAALQAQIDKSRDDNAAVQTATFTMGRRVIEMQRLYAQMQAELQRVQQIQMQMSAQHTR